MKEEEKKLSNKPGKGSVQSKRKDSGLKSILKKAGFKVWLAVMIIGGTLAFIVALFLL